jgi:excisionase family DNA binding protein
MKPMGEYLTTDEAAEILDVTAEAIRYRARQGELGAVKRGGRWWVERDQVLDLKRKVAGKDKYDPTRGA